MVHTQEKRVSLYFRNTSDTSYCQGFKNFNFYTVLLSGSEE